MTDASDFVDDGAEPQKKFQTIVSDEPVEAAAFDLGAINAGLDAEAAEVQVAQETEEKVDEPNLSDPTPVSDGKRKRRTKAEILADAQRVAEQANGVEAEEERDIGTQIDLEDYLPPRANLSVPRITPKVSGTSSRTEMELAAGRRALAKHRAYSGKLIIPNGNQLMPHDPLLVENFVNRPNRK